MRANALKLSINYNILYIYSNIQIIASLATVDQDTYALLSEKQPPTFKFVNIEYEIEMRRWPRIEASGLPSRTVMITLPLSSSLYFTTPLILIEPRADTVKRIC